MKKKTFKLLKKIRLRTWIAFGVIFLLLPIIALNLFRPYNPKAAWADESWIYRVPLTFTHNAAVTNTKVKFDIDTATLITAGKMQSDCGDSRFTDLNGNNLPYYLDSAGGACNTSSTDYYVLVPSIINGTNVIYHYYGNATAPNGTQGAQLDVSTTTPSGGAASTGTEENTPAPNGWWKFDQGSGTTAHDATQQNNDGTITEALWMAPERCVVNDCLWFDGSNDVVTVTNATQIDLNEGLSGGFTFEAWIRPNNAGEGTGGQVFNKGTNTWLKVASLSGGKLDLSGSLDLATTPATVTASAIVNANQWTHVAMSNAGSTVIKIWVNGQLVGTSSNGVGAFTADANNLLIGGGTSNNFQGFIDEPKVYKSERTTAQMISDALPGQGFQSQGSTSRGKNISLSNGLVAWWKLDETASTATDNSGNANSGTWTGNATRVTALYYNGITLDGTGDYVSAADSASLSPTAAVTIAAWVNPSSSIATKAIVVKDGSYRLVTDASGNPLCQINDGSWQTAATSSTALSLSTWQHVACTFDGRTESIYINGVLKGTNSVTTTVADSANALRIGSDSGGTYGDFNGAQDEVRVYNKALSGLDIANIYKWAPGPDGWWKLDEGSGTTAFDSSTNGFSGTITGSPTWTDGKYNKALLFDKTADQISAGDVLDMADKDNFTIELWVKIPSSISSNEFVLSKKDTGDSAAGWYIWFPSTNQPEFEMADGTNGFTMNFGTTTFSLNTWYHIAVVIDEDSTTNTTVYLNGIESKGDTNGTLTSVGSLANALNLRFASTATTSYPGYMDDIRIYRYTRTREQVQEDYLDSRLAATNNAAAGYWKLDETSGTTAYDSSTYGNNLTLSGSPTWTTSGKLNGGLTLSSASSQYGSVADSVALSLKGSLTVSAWIKPASTTAATLFPIAGKAGGDVLSYLLAQYGDEIRMYIGSSSNYVTTNASNLSTSTWYYVTGVYDETSQSVTIYINGRPQASTTTGTIPSSISDNADTFDIGRLGATTNLIYPITAGADDGTDNNGTWSSTNGGDGFGALASNFIHAGLRYLTVAIPNAATITTAFIRTQANTGFSTGTVSSVHGKIYGDDVDNAAAWSGTNTPSSANFTNTTAAIDWDPTTWTNDTTYDSPDITSVVQEIVNRAGWASGNNMRFAIKNDGTTGTNFVGFDSYETSHNTMSRLYVSYNTGGSASYYDGTIDEVKVYPMALSQEQVLVDQNFGSAASYSLGQDEANNLTNGTGTTYVGYYPIDENSGSATVYDHSGNGNDLTINGSIPKTAWQPGKIGSSLLLA